MTPKVEWCNWVFDYMDTNKWMVKRDIKFRIWDGVKNEWLASSNKDALPYYGFALVGEVMTVQSPPIWSLDEGNIVEQFTGLKDINDKTRRLICLN